MKKRHFGLEESTLPLFAHGPVEDDNNADLAADAALLSQLVGVEELVATRTLKAFGGFNRLLAARPERLLCATELTASQIDRLKAVESAGHRMARTDSLIRDVVSSWDQLMKYCQVKLAHRSLEELHVLYLDRQNQLIKDECKAVGTVDHVPVYPREILKSALECGASALILVHNHPSGSATPSEADVTLTESLGTAAEALGVTLHDHVIVGTGAPYSFKSHGLL